MPHPDIPPEALEKERELSLEKPKVNPWACMILLTITVALMGVTAAFVRTVPPSRCTHADWC
jgi:Ca2+:H+ antiporter